MDVIKQYVSILGRLLCCKMSYAVCSQGPGAVCVPENQVTSPSSSQGCHRVPCSPWAPGRGTCWVCSVGCQQSSRLRGGFRVPLLKESQDRSSCCQLKPALLCTLPRAGKAAVGSSRCKQPLLPPCHGPALYLCAGTRAVAVCLGRVHCLLSTF